MTDRSYIIKIKYKNQVEIDFMLNSNITKTYRKYRRMSHRTDDRQHVYEVTVTNTDYKWMSLPAKTVRKDGNPVDIYMDGACNIRVTTN